jgi:hypothetical protein
MGTVTMSGALVSEGLAVGSSVGSSVGSLAADVVSSVPGSWAVGSSSPQPARAAVIRRAAAANEVRCLT